MIAEDLEAAVPFFRVANLQASLPFYIDGLGFAIRYQWVVDGSQSCALAPCPRLPALKH